MKASKVTYVDFQKKKNVTERDIYNTQYDKWIDIKRACDPSMTIVHEAISYIAAIEFLFLKNPDEVIFNSNLLKKKSHHKERQRGRFLKQIAGLYDIEHHTSYDYKGKKHHFVFSAKRTKNSLEILENPELFYSKMAVKNDLDTSQKCLVCPSNLTATYIDNRNTVEVEEIAYGYISSTKEEKTYKKEEIQETENTTCSNAVLTEHSQVVTHKTEPNEVDKSDHLNKEKLLIKSEEKPNIQEEIPAMKQEEPNLIPDKETRQMLLSKALWSAFGAAANEIQDNCMFEELEPDKVGIKPSLGVSFNDIEKAKIRKCIKSVYGEEVKILAANTKPPLRISQLDEKSVSAFLLAKSEVLESSAHNNSQWLRFKASVNNSKLRHILNHPALKTIEVSNRIIIETYTFLINRITSEHLQDLEDAVFKTGLTLELHEKTVASDYVIRDKKTIVLSREKILKDQEWKTNTPDALDDLINELKNKEKLT